MVLLRRDNMAEAAYSISEFLRVVLKAVAEQRGREQPHRRATLPEDPQVIHKVFYEIPASLLKELPALKELHFIRAGAYPYSPELTEALDDLQTSGGISRENPSYERFSGTEYDDTKAVLAAKRQEIVGSRKAKAKALDDLITHLNKALPTK
jgi:hypothetical protein